MNVYRYNSKLAEWQLIPVGKLAEIGLSGSGEIAFGANVRKAFARLQCCSDCNGKARCVLIIYKGTAPDITPNINGHKAFPVQVLHDRDEIRIGGETLYFTDESPAQVVSFQSKAGEPPIFCARCKLAVKGDAVKCPGSCGLWYHQNEESNCWTYDSQCVVCQHPTGSGLSWKPAPRALKARARRGKRE